MQVKQNYAGETYIVCSSLILYVSSAEGFLFISR